MTVLQLYTFYPFDASVVALLNTKAANLAGCQGIYAGREIEDPDRGHCVFHWENESAALQSAEIQRVLLAGGRWVSQKTITISSESDKDIQTVLSAPVQEFAIATLKNDENKAEWERILRLTTEGVRVTEGAVASLQGLDAENDARYVLLIGWQSHEAHMRALQSEYADEVMGQTLAVVDFHVKHAQRIMYEQSS
ncbi:hypothetical protein EV122DRAFT_249136 [Schizophyllum commune]